MLKLWMTVKDDVGATLIDEIERVLTCMTQSPL